MAKIKIEHNFIKSPSLFHLNRKVIIKKYNVTKNLIIKSVVGVTDPIAFATSYEKPIDIL